MNIQFECKLIRPDWRESDISGFVYLARLGGYPYAIYFGAFGVSAKASFNRAGEELLPGGRDSLGICMKYTRLSA